MNLLQIVEKIIVSPNSECFLWTGTVNNYGYASVTFNKKSSFAHRVIYELFVGQIDESLELDHLCRNPRCVNPDHLEPVTHQENIRRGYWGMRTHCQYGHLLDGLSIDGYRYCLTCRREAQPTYMARYRDKDPERFKKLHRERLKRWRERERVKKLESQT